MIFAIVIVVHKKLINADFLDVIIYRAEREINWLDIYTYKPQVTSNQISKSPLKAKIKI